MILPPVMPGPHAETYSASRPFKAHLPETFDPAVTRPEWWAYAYWVVSAVVIRRYIEKDADEETFVPLGHDYINRHIPRNVRRPLLDDLLGGGVLECDNLYYFGRYFDGGPGKCLCYRLGEVHRGAPIRARAVTHTELLRKLNTAWQHDRDSLTEPTHIALRGWHDRVEVLPAAPYGEHPLLDRMIDGERRFKVCKQGRCHTNVANLPREYRQYTRMCGRELTSCDISTSQPLILAILLKNQRAEGRERGRRSHPAVYDTCYDPSLSDFLRDCLDGSVYDRVVELTGYTRDDVKSKFLAVVYGHPSDMHTRVGEAIRQLYPAVFDAVAELNRRGGRGALPRLMQKMESDVMIGRVAARLLRENPGMPLLTVHDSVLVPDEHAGAARRVIAEEWRGEFGVAPRVKTSAFTDPQDQREKKRKRRKRRRVW